MRFEPAADSLLLHHKVKEPLETKEKQKSSMKENVENEVLHRRIVEQLIEDEEDFVCAGTNQSCWEASNLMNDSVPITTEKVKFPF